MARPVEPPRQSGMLALLRERRGPLPVWAWLAIVVGLLLLVMYWRASRRPVEPESPDELPGDQTPPFVFNVPPATPVVNVQLPPQPPPTTTPPPAPPGGGRDDPPGSTPGVVVTVMHRYTSQNPAWDSTIWGIWNHYRNARREDRTTAATWQDLWNHPQNAGLRALRGTPQGLRVRDQVFVPGARAR